MATSQFTLYSSSDVSGPGLLTGQAGMLLALLDACLVNGYAGKSAAGWSKPYVNSGNIGCYKQGAGAGFGLVINDNGPNVTSTYKEAWGTAWESVAGVGAPVGSGSGQFPTPAQLLTTGHTVWRKSTSADSAGRAWLLAADASTFYLWIATGDAVGAYYANFFGDAFSMAGASDAYRCVIVAGAAENAPSPTAGSYSCDLIAATINSQPGKFMARTVGGGGTSILIGNIGNPSLTAGLVGSSYAAGLVLNGALQTPNSADNSIYLSPIWVYESVGQLIRGRMRGLFQIGHPSTNFTDGQTFAGGGDYAGKAFRIVKTGPAFVAGGTAAYIAMWALEISATVETN